MNSKKIFLVFAFLLATYILSAQALQPHEAIHVRVKIKADRINIYIPESYFTFKTKIPSVPSFVKVIKVQAIVPNIPDNDKIISILSRSLDSQEHPAERESQLKYLGQIVLLLYYSNNDENYLLPYIDEINWLCKQKSVREEAEIVKEWVEFTSAQANMNK